MQYRILTRLLDTFTVPPYIHAFEKGKSVPQMAALHVNKKEVVSLDIKDFFPSITQFQVNNVLVKLGFGGSAAQTLSELCTFGPRVPQGALTSPKISNLVTAMTFGPEVKALCEELGIGLSVYADDLTMSHSKEFETKESNWEFTDSLIARVSEILAKWGFRVNRAKTKVMRAHRRQWVCGAVVNSKVNMTRKERDLLKAVVHNCEMHGVEVEAAKTGLTPPEFLSRFGGRIGWYSQLDPIRGKALLERWKEVKSSTGDDIPKLAWSSGVEDLEVISVKLSAEDAEDAKDEEVASPPWL